MLGRTLRDTRWRKEGDRYRAPAEYRTKNRASITQERVRRLAFLRTDSVILGRTLQPRPWNHCEIAVSGV